MSSNNELKPWFLELMVDWSLKTLIVTLLVFCGFGLLMLIHHLGGTHPLSVFAISAMVCMILIVIDRFSTTKASKLQWASLIINMALLTYSFSMLPTNEAIEKLNELEVPANFWESLIESENT